VGCFHLPDYQITHLLILPLEHGRSIQVQIFVFSKSFVRHLTLGRCQTIAVFFARINCESGHVLGNQPRRTAGSSRRLQDQRAAEFVYLWALSHKPNPIKLMTSKTTNAASVR